MLVEPAGRNDRANPDLARSSRLPNRPRGDQAIAVSGHTTDRGNPRARDRSSRMGGSDLGRHDAARHDAGGDGAGRDQRPEFDGNSVSRCHPSGCSANRGIRRGFRAGPRSRKPPRQRVWEECGHGGAHRHPCPVNELAHRALREAHRLGDLRAAAALEGGSHERLPLPARQAA
jgi:hypothetical protein